MEKNNESSGNSQLSNEEAAKEVGKSMETNALLTQDPDGLAKQNQEDTRMDILNEIREALVQEKLFVPLPEAMPMIKKNTGRLQEDIVPSSELRR